MVTTEASYRIARDQKRRWDTATQGNTVCLLLPPDNCKCPFDIEYSARCAVYLAVWQPRVPRVVSDAFVLMLPKISA